MSFRYTEIKAGEPWPNKEKAGKAGKRKDLGSIPLRLPFLFKKVVVCGHCLVTLSITSATETLKWLSSLPILMQESFWWWQCSDRYIISLFPHLHTPLPLFSTSPISLMVPVDVKHHVYLLTYLSHRIKVNWILGHQRGGFATPQWAAPRSGRHSFSV